MMEKMKINKIKLNEKRGGTEEVVSKKKIIGHDNTEKKRVKRHERTDKRERLSLLPHRTERLQRFA